MPVPSSTLHTSSLAAVGPEDKDKNKEGTNKDDNSPAASSAPPPAHSTTGKNAYFLSPSRSKEPLIEFSATAPTAKSTSGAGGKQERFAKPQMKVSMSRNSFFRSLTFNDRDVTMTEKARLTTLTEKKKKDDLAARQKLETALREQHMALQNREALIDQSVASTLPQTLPEKSEATTKATSGYKTSNGGPLISATAQVGLLRYRRPEGLVKHAAETMGAEVKVQVVDAKDNVAATNKKGEEQQSTSPSRFASSVSKKKSSSKKVPAGAYIPPADDLSAKPLVNPTELHPAAGVSVRVINAASTSPGR